jgi:GTP cyclohydrolase I
MKLKAVNGNIPKTLEERNEIIKAATSAYEKFLDALGFDWRNDSNSVDTPYRVAKSYVNDLITGCYDKAPKITAFDNTDQYGGIIFQGNITVNSLCSHHHLPFVGFAHVAYIPTKTGKIIGLSKMNRIVEHYARRPQVQENLTEQIHQHLDETIGDSLGVAVMVEATHFCAKIRGVKHSYGLMKTSRLSGVFLDPSDHPEGKDARQEFYDFIKTLKRGEI